MSADWYVTEGDAAPQGPFATEEVLRRLESNEISRDAKVCPVGQDKWEAISEVDPFTMSILLKAAAAPAQPGKGPLPKLASSAPPAPKAPPRPGSLPSIPVPAALPHPSSPPRMQSQPHIPPQMLPSQPPGFDSKGTLPMPMPATRVPAGMAGNPGASKRIAMIVGAVVGALVLIFAVIFVVRSFTGREARLRSAIVRITTQSGIGTGFFLQGPDDAAYVATAYHVIDRGEPVLIERSVDVSDKRAFVEAYPETEVVAFDADADVAIIRIKNVVGSRFERLALAAEPIKDAKIFSYGFPGSSLAKRAGLVLKDGKILSLVKFPVLDRRYGRIVRDNAVDGLLVSTDIEPGFSGGPTTNEAGEVVGVNVTKDRAHVGQNGVVSVLVLKELLKKVKTVKEKADPTPEEVAALLKRIQSEVLLQPIDERTKVRETDYLGATELPALRRLVNEVRRQERNTDTSFVPKLKLSGQAALGIFFSRLPGKPLETYLAPSTKSALASCELGHQRLATFLEGLGGTKTEEGAQALQGCDDLALRPLAWDLTASTLQWDGKEKDYSVTKIERVDEEGAAFRVSVRISGAPSLVELWVAQDSGRLALKLFDADENVYAVKSPRSVPGSALAGNWIVKSPRVADPIDRDMDIVTEEHLSVSVQDEQHVAIRHVVNQQFFVSSGKKATLFRCSRKASIETGVLQSFSGPLDNGVVVAVPSKDAERTGADSGLCPPKYTADRIVSIKIVGNELYMVRTNGVNYPETKTFTKE